jgi:hypothetical protein
MEKPERDKKQVRLARLGLERRRRTIDPSSISFEETGGKGRES